MLYVEQSLGPDEELVHVGKFHWFHTFQAFMGIFWGVAGCIVSLMACVYMYRKIGWFLPDVGFFEGVPALHPGLRIMAFVIFALGLVTFIQKMLMLVTTEIAITNSRLVYKRGLIARQVGEMSIDRIEGVNVMQTMMGRIFNYGRLAIRGMGIGEVILPPIADPIAFRKAIERARSI